MKTFIGTILFLLVAFPAFAQVSYPLSTAKFSWSWTRGVNPGVDDGPVTSFNIKCGAGTGKYTTTFSVADPTLRVMLVRPVVGGAAGAYFCVITALNGTLESAPTPEIFFSVAVGSSTPAAFAVGP